MILSKAINLIPFGVCQCLEAEKGWQLIFLFIRLLKPHSYAKVESRDKCGQVIFTLFIVGLTLLLDVS